jgi:hypothetical protein
MDVTNKSCLLVIVTTVPRSAEGPASIAGRKEMDDLGQLQQIRNQLFLLIGR